MLERLLWRDKDKLAQMTGSMQSIGTREDDHTDGKNSQGQEGILNEKRVRHQNKTGNRTKRQEKNKSMT